MELTAYTVLRKAGLNSDVSILIVEMYREMCIRERMVYEQSKKRDQEMQENQEKLYRLWVSGKTTVHLSDLPHPCSINSLEKSVRSIWGNISHRCCSNTGIVMRCSELNRYSDWIRYSSLIRYDGDLIWHSKKYDVFLSMSWISDLTLSLQDILDDFV